MPVRKLTRGGTGESCGDADAVSGAQAQSSGAPEVLIVRHKSGGGEQSGGDCDAREGGQAGEGGQPEEDAQPKGFSPDRLQQAAAQVISELHSAKQELAQELEANLKQLKAVLQETQRIAKDMEAVLREAKAEPKQDDLAGKADSAGGKSQKPWNPPTVKKSGQKADGQVDWESAGNDSDDDQDQQQQKQPPQWEPPQDALQH